MALKDYLSKTMGEPTLLFRRNAAQWAKTSDREGCYVTDGPYLRTSKSGKL
jgi:hypothetical protein